MNTLTRTARLVAAAASLALTTTLFTSLVSISEPQRSALIAKTQAAEKLARAHNTLQLASGR